MSVALQQERLSSAGQLCKPWRHSLAWFSARLHSQSSTREFGRSYDDTDLTAEKNEGAVKRSGCILCHFCSCQHKTKPSERQREAAHLAALPGLLTPQSPFIHTAHTNLRKKNWYISAIVTQTGAKWCICKELFSASAEMCF